MSRIACMCQRESSPYGLSRFLSDVGSCCEVQLSLILGKEICVVAAVFLLVLRDHIMPCFFDHMCPASHAS